MWYPSGCFSDLLPVFSHGSECEATHSSFSLTWARPPLILWLGPQRASPGLEFSSQPCCLTLGKLLDSASPQLAPPKQKGWLGCSPKSLPLVSILCCLPGGRPGFAPAPGTQAGGAGWWRSGCTSVARAGTLNPDLEAASPGPWEAAGVQGK